MTQALKDLYSQDFIDELASAFQEVKKDFDEDYFKEKVFQDNWQEKELKQRMHHIANVLHQTLNTDYKTTINIFKKVIVNFCGFEYMFFPHYVENYGLNNLKTSIDALEFFTPFASSEFAVRVFIKKYPKQMLKQLKIWAKSPNHHVRRLASEGCRPRLPWAMALPDFKKNPKLILPILETLKNDSSEYVRRSVANNLNDIAKDNPQVVINIAKKWYGNNHKTDWLVKHASRTLLKAGDETILKLFGFNKRDDITITNFIVGKSITLGDYLNFSFSIKTTQNNLGKLRLEFIIDFVKKNGSTVGKIFQIAQGDYQEKQKTIIKKHPIKPITTRKYYPGTHKITLVINGQKLNKKQFLLKI